MNFSRRPGRVWTDGEASPAVDVRPARSDDPRRKTRSAETGTRGRRRVFPTDGGALEKTGGGTKSGARVKESRTLWVLPILCSFL